MITRTLLAVAALALILAAIGLAFRKRSGAGPVPADAGPAATDVGPAPTDATTTVSIYFSRGDSAVAVPRTVPAAAVPGTLSAAAVSGTLPVPANPETAVRALLAGPTPAELDSGIDSWFSAETAGLLHGVSLDQNGTAHVDFADLRPVIPGASSSAGSQQLLRELNQTLFQYPDVIAIEYTIDGSCETFWNWLQYDCQVVRRPNR